jgi:hypothetical protein
MRERRKGDQAMLIATKVHPLYDPGKAELAFDVMIRRRWGVTYPPGARKGWIVNGPDVPEQFWKPNPENWPDPFTALVEADKWMKENVEKETSTT